MSYDVYLEIDTGKAMVEVWWRNHTSNTVQMWREAGVDLAYYDGKSAALLEVPLGIAIANMKERPKAFREFESDNGWGTYESTLEFLEAIYAACKEHWRTTVRVSR